MTAKKRYQRLVVTPASSPAPTGETHSKGLGARRAPTGYVPSNIRCPWCDINPLSGKPPLLTDCPHNPIKLQQRVWQLEDKVAALENELDLWNDLQRVIRAMVVRV
jgi:hypothetical protein